MQVFSRKVGAVLTGLTAATALAVPMAGQAGAVTVQPDAATSTGAADDAGASSSDFVLKVGGQE
jgi:hypothetical protein